MTTRDPVTWRPLLLLMGGAIALNVSICWGLMTWHADRPHKGVAEIADLKEMTDEVKILHVRIADLTTQMAVLGNEIKHLREDRSGGGP